MAAVSWRRYVATLEKQLDEAIRLVTRTEQHLEEVTAKASKAREEADACPEAEDSKVRDLESLRDEIIEDRDDTRQGVEEMRYGVSLVWEIIHYIEANVPPAA